jgi:hypothetical protein
MAIISLDTAVATIEDIDAAMAAVEKARRERHEAESLPRHIESMAARFIEIGGAEPAVQTAFTKGVALGRAAKAGKAGEVGRPA